MSNFINELIIILVLLVLNGVLAMSEAALLSVRKARLQSLANDGDHKAKVTLKLLENPNQFLSTIQVGITLIDVLTGAIGGATLAAYLAQYIAQIKSLQPYSGTLGLVIVVLIISYFSIVFGELVPKRLAIRDPERVAGRVAGAMTFVSKLFSPITNMLGGSTNLVLRMIGVRHTEPPPVTEEEIQVLLDQGTQAGVIEAAEQDMVQGVFSLNDRRVNSLMTPRNEITWLDMNDNPDEIRRKLASSPYSRFPVCRDSMDHVLGVVKAKDVLLGMSDQKPEYQQILKPALYIPETAFGSRALEMFKALEGEIMLVFDEFGVVQGLITLSDILEEIVGDIDIGEPQATQRQDGSWLLDGKLPIDDFKEIFNLRVLPAEEEYETLGGFVMTTLGRIPVDADNFEWSSLRFEVMDMDAMRVDKILVTTLPIRAPSIAPKPEEMEKGKGKDKADS
ncbi:MAG: hemolysin family protein [Chloroflexota bacterium]